MNLVLQWSRESFQKSVLWWQEKDMFSKPKMETSTDKQYKSPQKSSPPNNHKLGLQ